MIPQNIIQRTFHIKVGDDAGTCFSIDVDNKQYLVTAKHLVKDLNGSCTIQIFHEQTWKDNQVTVVGHCRGSIDISVLKAERELTPPDGNLEPNSAEFFYGQDAYFLGFPYNLSGKVDENNRGYPFPFVKKCIISCFDAPKEDPQVIYLDGYNNPGFSGGPLVYIEQKSKIYKVAAVVSGYRFSEEPIFEGKTPSSLIYKHNTGIIYSYGIKHAIELVESNPIGFAL